MTMARRISVTKGIRLTVIEAVPSLTPAMT